MQQVSRSHPAAVRDRIEVALAPVPCSVKADRKPQIPGAAQGETEKKTDQNGTKNTDPAFARILQMKNPEARRQQGRGRPEAGHLGQGELGVAAHKKFLVETNDEEERTPEHGKLDHAHAVQREAAEVEGI